MKHKHVKIAVADTNVRGVEHVPAIEFENGEWELINSPLYATQVAAGDIIRILDSETGAFEIVHHGGNISVQFYLAETQADDIQATNTVIKDLASAIAALNGRMDGYTAGLIVYSIPAKAGFSSIEKLFDAAVFRFPGAQWQYCNVFNPSTGEPLNWWDK